MFKKLNNLNISILITSNLVFEKKKIFLEYVNIIDNLSPYLRKNSEMSMFVVFLDSLEERIKCKDFFSAWIKVYIYYSML